jgi:hypothetical protein
LTTTSFFHAGIFDFFFFLGLGALAKSSGSSSPPFISIGSTFGSYSSLASNATGLGKGFYSIGSAFVGSGS